MRVILIITIMFLPALLSAQGGKFKSCDKTYRQVRKEWSTRDVVPLIREYLGNCSHSIGVDERARLLMQLGRSLEKSGDYSEAQPILKECRELAAGNSIRGELSV